MNDIEPSRQYCVLNQLVPFFYLFILYNDDVDSGGEKKKETSLCVGTGIST